jgi:hypothetical protein
MTDRPADAAGWSDRRLERALAALADELVVPAAPEKLTFSTRRQARGRALAVAAAVLGVAVGVIATVPDTRDAVAGWLGLGSVRLERVAVPTEDRVGLPRLDDDVVAVDVDEALVEAGVTTEALDAAGLGRPDEAGRPPEGGVVLAWNEGSTTLWVLPAHDGPAVVKQLGAEDRAEVIAGVGEAAVLIEGDHVLSTPARELAADRVLWWIVSTREHRLESDRVGAELIAIGRALTS